jgi:acid phosphatase class B
MIYIIIVLLALAIVLAGSIYSKTIEPTPIPIIETPVEETPTIALVPPPVSLVVSAPVEPVTISRFDQVMADIYSGKKIIDTPFDNKDLLDQAANMVSAGKQYMTPDMVDKVEKETFKNTMMWNKSTRYPFKK